MQTSPPRVATAVAVVLLALCLPLAHGQVDPAAPWGEFATHDQDSWRTSSSSCANLQGTGGTAIWTKNVGKTISSSAAIGADNTVYFGSDDGYFHSVDGETGDTKWVRVGGDHFASSPSIGANGVVYTGCNDQTVYAFNVSNGQQVWSFEVTDIVYSSPTLGPGNMVYAIDLNGYFIALDGSSGNLVWHDMLMGGWSTTAVGYDGNTYIVDFNCNLYSFDSQGNQRCTSSPGGTKAYASTALTPALAVWGTEDGTVYASNTTDCSTVWSFTVGAPVSSFAIFGGVVFFGSQNSVVYALEVATGAVKWKYTAGGPVFSSPVATKDGFLYFGCADNNLYALDVETGTLLWRYPTSGNMRNGPAIDKDGNILVGDDGGFFHKVQCGRSSGPTPPPPPSPPSCNAPDVYDMRSECGGQVYDFSCLYPGPEKFFHDRDGVFDWYLQLVDGGLPDQVSSCDLTNAPNTTLLLQSPTSCYPTCTLSSQPWLFTPGTSSTPQSFKIELDCTIIQSGSVEVICDPSAITPVINATLDLDAYVFSATIRSVLACKDYVPSKVCPQDKAPQPVQALTPCKLLSLDVGTKKRVKTFGRMFDVNYLPMDEGRYVMTRSDYSSCTSVADPVFQLSVEMDASTLDSNTMSWKASNVTLFIGSKAASLASVLNAQCPCGGNFSVGQWRTVRPSQCSSLPPPNSHWLCWVLSGNQFETDFDVFGVTGYARSMLNTSVVQQHNPDVDSPVFLIEDFQNYGNASICDVTLWNQCGGVITDTVPKCAGIPDGTLTELCLLSGFSDAVDFSLPVCCPCVERYAEANKLDWARLKCAS